MNKDKVVNGINLTNLKSCEPSKRAIHGWAIAYVKGEKPIPRMWYNDFLDELTSDNDEYRYALEASIRYFGVRWS